MTSNSDLIRYFQNVKQIYLRGILTRKRYNTFVFLTPYWENHFQVMKIKLSLKKIKLSYLEILEGLTTHYILIVKISRGNSFVPRSGIFSTSSGTFCTRPWYKKYQYWNFNHKQVVEEVFNFWWSNSLDNSRKDVSFLRQDKYFVPSLHTVFLIVMLTGSALIWNHFINPCVINATGT